MNHLVHGSLTDINVKLIFQLVYTRLQQSWIYLDAYSIYLLPYHPEASQATPTWSCFNSHPFEILFIRLYCGFIGVMQYTMLRAKWIDLCNYNI